MGPTMTPSVVRVTTLADLRRVTHTPITRSLLRTEAPSLQLLGATDAELQDWQKRLDRELYACGCTSGAIAMLAALASLAPAQFVLGVGPGSGVSQVVVWISVALTAALGGKAFGLLRARRRRRSLYAEIERALTDRGRISTQPLDGGRREHICAVSVCD